MNLAELAAEQWNDYSDRHRNKVNLLIHIVTVPLIWWSALLVLGGFLLMLMGVGGLTMWVYAVIITGVSLFAQSYGNGMEEIKPKPFGSPKDFAMNAIAEQFVTFPRFVLSGQWLRNFQAAG